jgi:hypothetical protein
MASKAIQRTLLVVALIVTAHALKPFSVGSVAYHLLRSANSFSFLLPDSALSSLEQADYLAAVLDSSLRQTDLRREDIRATEIAWASGLLPSPQCTNAPRVEVLAKGRSSTKNEARRAKGLAAANRVKSAKKESVGAMTLALPVNLPVSEAIEKVVTLKLPEVASLRLPAPDPMDGQVMAAHFVPSTHDPKCATSKVRQIRIVTGEEAAQERLRLSLKKLLADLSPAKAAPAKSHACAPKVAIQLNTKSS